MCEKWTQMCQNMTKMQNAEKGAKCGKFVQYKSIDFPVCFYCFLDISGHMEKYGGLIRLYNYRFAIGF